jgi:hypothetical protein
MAKPQNEVLNAIFPSSIPQPFVAVNVNGRKLQLPEPALSAGLSYLRLTTEGHVGFDDYAEAVALVLAALENYSLVTLRA